MSTKATQEETRRRLEPPTNALFDAAGSIEPLFQASNKWLETWMAVSSEILEFGKTRLDRSVEAGRAIARTSSIDQAVELQADYARSMMRDYMEEAGKLADMSTRAMLESLTALQPARRAN